MNEQQYKIDGLKFAAAARSQAFSQGKRAALDGRPASSNPYGMTVPQWDMEKREFIKGSEQYCPTEMQRDEWQRGFTGRNWT